MIRRIAWVSQHLEIDTMTGKLKNEESKSEYEEKEEEEYNNEKPQNVLSTPFGIWRVDDAMNPYKQFKLWMGHTNFTITKQIADVMVKIPGIEVLGILTRYRFLIGIGELFKIRDVRTTIEKTLNCNNDELNSIYDNDLRKEVEKLKEKLIQKYKKWAIYVFPNSSINFVTDENGIKEFTQKLLLYKKAVDHSSGVLIESEE